MKKEPVYADDDKYFSYKNKRDSNGKLILIDSFDPFNDGKGNHRMGEYLSYIFDEYKKNFNKQDTIDLANKKYSKVYGNKLIFN